MKPKLVSENKMYLIGMNFYGDPFGKASGWNEENEIGVLWKRFIEYYTHNLQIQQPEHTKNIFLEIWIMTEETETVGNLEVFVGVLVDTLESIPLQCSGKELPATDYAVFTLQGAQITDDWDQHIYQEWLPAAGYEPSYTYNFQYYDARFKGLDNLENSAIDVYIPVKKKTR
jgi:AraC family transcriptional regulator